MKTAHTLEDDPAGDSCGAGLHRQKKSAHPRRGAAEFGVAAGRLGRRKRQEFVVNSKQATMAA